MEAVTTMAESDSKLITLGDQAESCDVYNCTLALEDHMPLEEGAEETWHFNEVDRVHWPVLTPEADLAYRIEKEQRLLEDRRIFELNREIEQIKHRLALLQLHAPRWSFSLEDAIFLHRMMGQATAFSGDFKPVD